MVQLEEQSIPTPEIYGLNPLMVNFCLLTTVPIEKTKIKKKMVGMDHLKNTSKHVLVTKYSVTSCRHYWCIRWSVVGSFDLNAEHLIKKFSRNG